MIETGKYSFRPTIWLILAAFLLFVGPLALNYHFYYPDEVHYSDAAIQMLKTGDYLSPVSGNGELRFNKPILTYWIIAAAYQLMGISPFSTRIFFLLAGSLVVLLVFKIGKMLSVGDQLGILAAFIAASHVTFLMSSMRAIPDIFLALFITLGAWGVTGIIQSGKLIPKKYFWGFYLGIALAFEVKGVPAIVLGGSAILYLIINQWSKKTFNELLFWPAILTAFIVSIFWPVAMFLQHGQQFVHSFYNDQIGTRLSFNFITIIGHLLLATALLIVLYLPWNLFLISFKKDTPPLPIKTKAFLGFATCWAITLVILSAFLYPFYERYLLPVIPVGAVCFAFLITNREALNRRLFIGIITFLFLIGSLIGLIGLYLNLKIDPQIIPISFLLIGMGLVLIISTRAFSKPTNLVYVGLLILIIPYLVSFSTRIISFPNDGDQISSALQKLELTKNTRIGFIGNFEVASKTRVYLQGKYTIVNLDSLTGVENKGIDFLIGDKKAIEFAIENHLFTKPIAVFWEKVPAFGVLKSIQEKNYKNFKNQFASTYYLVDLKPLRDE